MTEISKVKQWHMGTRVQRTLQALKNNGFTIGHILNKEDAATEILKRIPSNALVGIGGSITVRELGLVEALHARGNTIAEHWGTRFSPEERIKIRRQQLTSDVFLTSSNAITETGKLVNVDGAGQRVAAMIFGPKKVIVIVGVNKIVPNVEAALNRIENKAAPLNAKRLNCKTPCTTTGVCSDCESSERICNVMTIISKRPHLTDISVIIVGEEVGY